jgi:3-oxoacyl-[acyl-carrier protein] reductase
MEKDMSRLAGRVALVTGGSRGIGAAIARRLATDGADVALTYSRSAARAEEVVGSIEALGRRALAIAADNLEPNAIERALKLTVERFGRLDILVNNAGVFHAGPVEQLSYDDFERTIAINVRAPFLASKIAAGHMGEGGRILSIGSNLAVRVPGQGLSLYSLSKAALIGMTKGMARDLGPKGITVNVVHPGSTDTEMNPAGGPGADDQRAAMAMPRFSDPGEVAALVAWLAGAEAGRVTGAEFTVDGGANA